ncbi:MAG: efflux RND transporter periplasmic adaptor subunit [Cytophagaceae bacterium]|nr:efflux RND transporter periplasmic adaptor subunit [Cytophagaceae bacterium]
MKNITLKKLIIILIPIVLIALVVVKLKKNKSVANEKIYTYDKNTALPVKTMKISEEEYQKEMAYSGVFEANRETRLSAEVQGKLNAILVDAGSQVRQGQLLIKLDDALLKQQLKTAEVMIQNLSAETEIQLQNNAVQLAGMEADVRRYNILAASDAIQGVQLEKAEIQLKNAQNQRRTLQQQSAIKNSEAQKAGIVEQIKKTSILAPFSGIVTAKLSEIGSFAAPGVPLLQITELSTLKFTINVPESDLKYFKLGQSFRVIPDAYSDVTFSGKVSMVGSKGNAGNSFPVQLILSNTSDQKIKAGMMGKVFQNSVTQQKGLPIPASALQGSAEKPMVYLVKNGKAQLQEIKIAERTSDKVLIKSGLNPGDEIVVSGFINLFDGANIKVTQ